MSPRVSVVMPAYCSSPWVGAAVSSVMSQSYPDFELVVVDDGSTDGTLDIACSFSGPIHVVTQDHAGVAAARNSGVAMATGELIAFCDSDDFLFDDYLQALVSVYDRHGGIVAGNVWYLFPGGVSRLQKRHRGRYPHPSEQRRAILEQNFLPIMCVFSRTMWEELGGFSPDLMWAEDWDFWMRAIFAGHRVTHQPRPLALVRWRPLSLSAATQEMDAGVREVLRRATLLDLSPGERDYVEARLAGPGPQELARQARADLRQGRYREASRLLRSSARLQASNRTLVWKSRALALAPELVGPLLRMRSRRQDNRFGTDEGYMR